ncbi:MAG TPA: RNA methyltransferase [Azospirillaceae bacterium]|nr:RNA methyltransferase [Azospirillaceae bacterium]
MSDIELGGPAVILVEPQLGENIGAAARAMLNCGLTDLRLVNPRDGWPNPKADAASSGASIVIENARVFDSTAAAIADLEKVYATTARKRDMTQRVVTARKAAEELRAHHAVGRSIGILFGPERTGLFNDDLALADTLITIPLNPDFSSLNLGQGVLVVGYEWWMTGNRTPDEYLHTGNSRPCTKDELLNLFEHLEAELDDCGFFSTPDKRPSMVRNIRNMLQRAHMTEQEVRTFHGIIAGLAGRKKPSRS